MKESQDKPAATAAQPGSDDFVKPFQDASMKFLQAATSAYEGIVKDSMQAYSEFQQTARKLQQDTYEAVTEATRKHMSGLSEQPAGGKPEDVYSSRLQAQRSHENELRQTYTNAQSSLQDLMQKYFGAGNEDLLKKYISQRQEAYQQYMGDLQQAWSGASKLDPQTVKAIASSIVWTLNSW